MEHSHIHNDNCKVKAQLANVSPLSVCDVDSIIVGSFRISQCRVTSQACSDIAVCLHRNIMIIRIVSRQRQINKSFKSSSMTSSL